MSGRNMPVPAMQARWAMPGWLWWALAGAVGWAMLPLSAIPLWGVLQAVQGNASLALQFVVAGLVLSAGQGLVLRRSLPSTRWWAGPTAAGILLFGLVTLLITMLPDVFAGTLSSVPLWLGRLDILFGGTLVGVPQWLVLRRHVRRAAWWVGASTVGWIAGVIVGVPLAGVLVSTYGRAQPDAVAWALPIAAGLAVGGALYGVVLGLALRVLVRSAAYPHS
jgi:hypothetical protein